MADKFEKDLQDLDQAFIMQLLPPYNKIKNTRKIVLSIIIEYSPFQKEINFVFHSGAKDISIPEMYFIFKQEGFKNLSEHFANRCQKYVPNSSIKNNIIKIPVHFDQFYKFIKFFEKENTDWQIEWVTKWELKNALENHYDIMLNIESVFISDTDLMHFLNEFERKLKKHFFVV